MLPVLCRRVALTCRPLRSAGFHRFQRYYETIRLLANRRRTLRFLYVVMPLPLHPQSPCGVDGGTCQTSRVCKKYLCMLATLSDPGGISPAKRLRLVLAACGGMKHIGFRVLYLRGSIASRFPIAARILPKPFSRAFPSLKPHLAASAPRTRYRLVASLCRAGSRTLLYFLHRTGAPTSLFYHFFTRKSSVPSFEFPHFIWENLMCLYFAPQKKQSQFSLVYSR